jgi:transposase InsO family protein
MPWQELSIMSQRLEFVCLARQETVSFRELCRRFHISAPTGYKWLSRCNAEGPSGLSDRSRRPHGSPFKTPEAVEQVVLKHRGCRETWGGRKLASSLIALGHPNIPAPSTITQILRRHNALVPSQGGEEPALSRFEYEHPNDLWQMDFKGHFPMKQGRCHPLTILDDHSRYSITVRACGNEQGETVQNELVACFRRYGLPSRILMDNGSPWKGQNGISNLVAWLMRLDIHVMHGRPYHPQTQGKEERFHRTLKADVLQFRVPDDIAGCQKAFDEFRIIYNHERPHEALGMKPPISRYVPSARAYPEILPPIEYAPQDQVRKVFFPGQMRFQGRTVVVGRGLIGQHVAVRNTLQDGVYEVIYCSTTVRQIDLRRT